MKIQFEDKSYINCEKNNEKIIITVAAKDYANPLKKITNSVELTLEEFRELISDVQAQIISSQ